MLNRKLLGWIGAGLLSVAVIPGISFAKSHTRSKSAPAAKSVVHKSTKTVSKKSSHTRPSAHVRKAGSKRYHSKHTTVRQTSSKRHVSGHKHTKVQSTRHISSKSKHAPLK